MKILNYDENELKKSQSFLDNGSKYNLGQVTIVGGSKLFHGAPILALKAASRFTGMTFFSSIESDKGVLELVKSRLSSFVWVDRVDLDSYVEKSEAILVGPGLMRSHVREQNFVCDGEGDKTRELTLGLLKKFPKKKWIVDGGSLQVVSPNELPSGSAITPNEKEFEMLFGEKQEKDIEKRIEQLSRITSKFDLLILTKGEVNVAVGNGLAYVIRGGNEGLVKGGVGDVIAGTALGLAAKNDLLWSLAGASLLVKRVAEKLSDKVGFVFNSDDVTDELPKVYKEIVG